MKEYTKPSMQIIDSLSEKFCAVVVESVSENEVNDRIVIETEDIIE